VDSSYLPIESASELPKADTLYFLRLNSTHSLETCPLPVISGLQYHRLAAAIHEAATNEADALILPWENPPSGIPRPTAARTCVSVLLPSRLLGVGSNWLANVWARKEWLLR
jgi:hypothetical protein